MGPQADQFVVECGCRCKLRIALPFAADRRARCPRCSQLLPVKTLVTANPEYRFVCRIAVIFLVIGLIPIVWPAGWYLIAAIALLYALTWLKLGTEIRGWAGSKRFLKLLCFNSVKGVQELSLWVSIGILIVCAAQFVLRVFFAVASDVRVYSIEVGLVAAQTYLSHHLTLKWVLGGLVCWFLIATIWPRTVKMSQFQGGRKWLGRTATVLTIITSFSFFSANSVASMNQDWIAGRRLELAQSVKRIRNARRQLVTDAYLQQQIKHLSEQAKVNLATYFSSCNGNEQPVRALADEILKTEPPLNYSGNESPDPEPPPPNKGPVKPDGPPPAAGPHEGASDHEDASDIATEESIERTDDWVSDRTSAMPTLADTQRVTNEAARSESLLETSTSAVEESLKAAIGTHWKPAFDSLVKPFVSSLQSSVIKTSVSKVIPRGVTSVKAALGWVAKNVPYSRAEWAPSIGTVEDYWRRQTPVVAETRKPTVPTVPEPDVPRSTLPLYDSGSLEQFGTQLRGATAADFLIEHLACNREDVRLKSAQMLNQLGRSLTAADVGKIVKLLDDNGIRYRISPDGRFYDTAPVRFYAAKALNGMNSKYLTMPSRQSAREIVSEFKTPHYTMPATRTVLRTAEL